MYTGKEVNMEFTYIHLYMLDLVGELEDRGKYGYLDDDNYRALNETGVKHTINITYLGFSI